MPMARIHAVGDHSQAILGNPQPVEYLGLEIGEHDHLVVASQRWGIKLIGQLLAAGSDVAQRSIKGGVEGGHKRHLQLLAELRQAEIQR